MSNPLLGTHVELTEEAQESLERSYNLRDVYDGEGCAYQPEARREDVEDAQLSLARIKQWAKIIRVKPNATKEDYQDMIDSENPPPYPLYSTTNY